MRKAFDCNEAASCWQAPERFRQRSNPFRDTRPRLRSVGPDQHGRTVPSSRPLEPGRQLSIVGPGSTPLGREEGLRTLVPRRFDRAQRGLSAPLFVDETVPGVPLQVVGRMEGEGQNVVGQTHRSAEGNPASAEERTPATDRICRVRSNESKGRRMDLGKRCLCGPLPPANARRGHGRGPPRKPENLGPAGNVPPKLGGEEGADRTRGRAGGCGEDDPSPWYRVPFRDQRLFSARSVSEPEKGPGTFAERIGNPSGSNHGARWQGRTICP